VDYSFPDKNGKPFVVRGFANFPLEVASALAGVKPSIHVWYDQPDRAYLEELSAAFGWEILEVKKSSGSADGSRQELILGPNKKAVQEASRTWYHPYINPGEFLGYPLCCVERFREWSSWVRRVLHSGDFTDVIRHSFQGTKNKKGLPFVGNDLFYCYSRHWRPGDDDTRRSIENLNPGLDMATMNLITWHPCSYRCEETKKRGTATFNYLAAHAPELAARIKACLAKPVIVWDWARFAVLRGTMPKAGVVKYEAVQPPFAPLDDKTLALLKRGDELRATKDSVTVYAKGKKIGAFTDGAMLLDFSGK
jgi:hypothetical protein